MNVNDLKIGDIIITDVNEVDGGQYPKIIVVGSAPFITVGQNVTFRPVLKRNRREDYYVAANTSRIDLNGDNLDNVVAVLSTMEDAFNFNVSDQFDVEADDDWVEKVNKKIAIAFKKRNWILDLDNDQDEEENFELDANVAAPRFNISRLHVVIKHDPDTDAEALLADVFNHDGNIEEFNIINLS